MYRILTNLINKKFYATKEMATAKVDIAFAMGKITEEQYTDLTMVIEKIYPEPVEKSVETTV